MENNAMNTSIPKMKDSTTAKSASTQVDKMISEGAPIHSSPHLSSVAKTLEAGHDWISDVHSRTLEVEETFQSYIKKNAIPAVLVAVGVGFFGSLLFKKMSSTSHSVERNHS